MSKIQLCMTYFQTICAKNIMFTLNIFSFCSKIIPPQKIASFQFDVHTFLLNFNANCFNFNLQQELQSLCRSSQHVCSIYTGYWKAESISLLCIPDPASGTECSRNCKYQDYVVTVQNCVWMTCVSIVLESAVTQIHPLVHHPAIQYYKDKIPRFCLLNEKYALKS